MTDRVPVKDNCVDSGNGPSLVAEKRQVIVYRTQNITILFQLF